MDKIILCLANSYKHGGRCIAGVEVGIENGQLSIKKSTFGLPIWIRPISHSAAGEVPISDAMGINVLSVVKLYDVYYAGNASHSEDYYYKKIEKIDWINPSDTFLHKYIDNWHQNIFGNRGRAITPEDFMRGNYSLMLIRTEGCEIYLDNRYSPKPRVKFIYNGIEYDFPITDPIFIDKLRVNPALYNAGYDVVYIVASLAVVHDGWHSKLAATIIFPSTNNIKEFVNINEFPVDKRNSPLQTEGTAVDQVASVDQSILHEIEQLKTNSTLMQSSLRNLQSKTKIFEELDKENASIRLINDSLNKNYNQNLQPSKQGCYIATAVYGSYNCPEVCVLRRFRDNVLAMSMYGRLFIKAYYWTSPYIVKKYGSSKLLKSIVKPMLDKWVKHLHNKGLSSKPYEDRT